MAECLHCKRIIRRGRTCSALHCVAQSQRQSDIDERALRNNPRWLAAQAEAKREARVR